MFEKSLKGFELTTICTPGNTMSYHSRTHLNKLIKHWPFSQVRKIISRDLNSQPHGNAFWPSDILTKKESPDLMFTTSILQIQFTLNLSKFFYVCTNTCLPDFDTTTENLMCNHKTAVDLRVSFLSFVIFSVCVCVVVCSIPIFEKSLSNDCVHPMSYFFVRALRQND